MDLNLAVVEVEKRLKLHFPAVAVSVRASRSPVLAEMNENVIAAMAHLMRELADRFEVKQWRIENGFSAMREGFSCLMSGSCASYAYLAIEAQFSSRIGGELSPFCLQGAWTVKALSSALEGVDGFLQVETSDVDTLRFTSRMPIASPAVHAVEKSMIGKTILLVEDEDFVRNVTQEVLEMEGFRVLSAGSGPDALKTLERDGSEIDLLLSDIVLPGMNGRDLAQRLVMKLGELKVMFMSGYAENAVSNGKDDQSRGTYYLHKPFTLESLVREVKNVLELDSISGPVLQRQTETAERAELRF